MQNVIQANHCYLRLALANASAMAPVGLNAVLEAGFLAGDFVCVRFCALGLAFLAGGAD